MNYMTRVRYDTDGSCRVLLPFGLEDGCMMAVRRINPGTRSVTLMYAEQWDDLRRGLSDSHVPIESGVHESRGAELHLMYASRPFSVEGQCVLLDREFSEYLDADFVHVANGRTIRIEPFTKREKVDQGSANAA